MRCDRCGLDAPVLKTFITDFYLLTQAPRLLALPNHYRRFSRATSVVEPYTQNISATTQ